MCFHHAHVLRHASHDNDNARRDEDAHTKTSGKRAPSSDARSIFLSLTRGFPSPCDTRRHAYEETPRTRGRHRCRTLLRSAVRALLARSDCSRLLCTHTVSTHVRNGRRSIGTPKESRMASSVGDRPRSVTRHRPPHLRRVTAANRSTAARRRAVPATILLYQFGFTFTCVNEDATDCSGRADTERDISSEPTTTTDVAASSDPTIDRSRRPNRS